MAHFTIQMGDQTAQREYDSELLEWLSGRSPESLTHWFTREGARQRLRQIAAQIRRGYLRPVSPGTSVTASEEPIPTPALEEPHG